MEYLKKQFKKYPKQGIINILLLVLVTFATIGIVVCFP